MSLLLCESFVFSKSLQASCEVGFAYARNGTRLPLNEFDLRSLNDHMCEIGEPLFAVATEGFTKDLKFEPLLYKAAVHKMVAGSVWPVGCSLILENLEERPGSLVVTFDVILGGRDANHLGPQFSQYAVRISM